MNKYRVERTLVVVQDVEANSVAEAMNMAEGNQDLSAMVYVDEVDVKVTEELKGASNGQS
jgi:hypothetical protein